MQLQDLNGRQVHTEAPLFDSELGVEIGTISQGYILEVGPRGERHLKLDGEPSFHPVTSGIDRLRDLIARIGALSND